MTQAGTPGRFGAAAASAVGRREQRERERALGLVPFAVKLDGETVVRRTSSFLSKPLVLYRVPNATGFRLKIAPK